MTDFVSSVAENGDRYGVLETGGFRLSYIVEGQGFPLLVVGSASYYARCFPAFLRRDCRFHFVDHCGFAKRSDGYENRDFSLDRIVRDIERMRIHLGLERFAILGHSGHGYMALAYAARFPERVSHVVLVGTAPNQSEALLNAAEERFLAEASSGRKAILDHDLDRLARDIEADPGARFSHLLLRLRARSWNDPSYDAGHLWQDVPINDVVFDHLWGVVFRDIDMAALAASVSAPVLIAIGARDYLIAPAQSWAEYRSAFADSQVIMFANSGHTPPLEEPEVFGKSLLEFLRH